MKNTMIYSVTVFYALLGVTLSQYGGGSLLDYYCYYYGQYYPQYCGYQRPPPPLPPLPTTTTTPPPPAIGQYYSSFTSLPMSFYSNYMADMFGGCPTYSGYTYGLYQYGRNRYVRETPLKREKRAYTSAQSKMYSNILKAVNQVLERYNMGYPNIMNKFLMENSEILNQYSDIFADVIRDLDDKCLKILAESAVGAKREARLENTLAMSGQDKKASRAEIILARHKVITKHWRMTDKNVYKLALKNNKDFMSRSSRDKVKTLNAMVRLSGVSKSNMRHCVNQYTNQCGYYSGDRSYICRALKSYMTSPYIYCSTYILASRMYVMCGCQNLVPPQPPATAAPTAAPTAVPPTTPAATTAAPAATTAPPATTAAPTTAAATTPAATRNCGVSDINPASSAKSVQRALSMLRIVGGNTAEDGEWPWMVLLKINSGGSSYLCGGTIIDATHVLTAAHCTDGAKAADLTVVVGEHDKTDPTDSEEVSVSAVAQHPGYTNSPTNDVTVLTLTKPLDLSLPDRSAVCLADSTSPKLTSDMTCYIAGWGTISSGGSTPNKLLDAVIPAYEIAECQSKFSTTYTQPDYQVCAGDPAGGVDTCQGDSGGPLFCAVNGKWVQYGVTSYGVGCADPKQAGVYASVVAFGDYIKSA